MKKRVLVVGAGLAGLATAYELSLHGDFDVTVLEVEPRVGGRAHTKKVQGVDVDFGGFIIFPWYKAFHNYMQRLNLQASLSRIPPFPIYYEIHGDGQYVEKVKNPYAPFSPLKTFRNLLLPALLSQNPRHPNLDAFEYRTVHELLQSCMRKPGQVSDLEKYCDLVSQGYCYGSLDRYKASLGVPVFTKSTLFGDVKKSTFIKEGITVLTEAFAKAITDNGGKIRTSVPVLDIDPVEKILLMDNETCEGDIIVLAQPVNNLTGKALGIPETTTLCEYTHFIVATVRFPETPKVQNTTDWGSVFYRPHNTKNMQILSSINLHALYGEKLAGHINLNIQVKDANILPSREDLFENIYDDILERFPGQAPSEIVESVFWLNTMPIAQEALVEKARVSQGENDIFFAGDYLGCPSMETALATGQDAAAMIIAKHAQN